MADWFKFYENALDEPRFQYAVGQLPEVVPVWVGVLSECCRMKSGTISWDDDEAYLMGFSRRLNVSVPKVNEAVNLLQRIRYIKIEDGKLTVLKWGEMQSEYMKRKYRDNPIKHRQNTDGVRTVSEHSPNSVRTVSGQCPARGEERRGEDKRVPTPTPPVESGSFASAKELVAFQKEVGDLIGRKGTFQWSREEQELLCEVHGRDDFASEWGLVRPHVGNLKGTEYFPRSVFSFLKGWTRWVDNAGRSNAPQKPTKDPAVCYYEGSRICPAKQWPFAGDGPQKSQFEGMDSGVYDCLRAKFLREKEQWEYAGRPGLNGGAK